MINFECLHVFGIQGVKVVDESHDQDTTDLHKCVAYVNNSTPVEEKSKVCYPSYYYMDLEVKKWRAFSRFRFYVIRGEVV